MFTAATIFKALITSIAFKVFIFLLHGLLEAYAKDVTYATKKTMIDILDNYMAIVFCLLSVVSFILVIALIWTI